MIMRHIQHIYSTIRQRIGLPIKKLAAEEDGAATVLTLFLFIMILGITGMSVDLMRLKDRQARIQDVADRAVIAATNLYSPHDPTEIVESYFEKAGLSEALVSTNVADTGVYREVSVDTVMELDTLFLHLVGLDMVESNVSSTAIQGVGDVEVSLVIDISASMDGSRIESLREAATSFAITALDPDNQGKVSLNVIAFGGNVNIGPDMFEYLNSVHFDQIQVEGANTETLLDDVYELNPDAWLEGQDTVTTDDDYYYPSDLAHCLEIASADFSSSGLPSFGTPQSGHFLSNSAAIYGDASRYDAPHWCPLDDMQIRYAEQDAGDISDPDSLLYFIDNLQLSWGTGTQFGAKMGLALLDPTTQPAFEFLNTRDIVPDDFTDRPLPYGQLGVQKILVLMTDGETTPQYEPKDYLHPDNLVLPLMNGSHRSNRNRTSLGNANKLLMADVCDLAKDTTRNVEIFTVAFESNSSVETEMESCASSSGHFYSASGSELTTVFDSIAHQISELRLTQ
jgi:Flp pilus assembly protein TadG